jgi:large subunit ribosomal protein L18
MRLLKTITRQRKNRAHRVRNRVRGCEERPRLTVFRSNKHIYAQIIDDTAGRTLVACSTAEKTVCGAEENGGSQALAKKVGATLATRAIDKGIKQVCFDRGSYRYHGRVAALADAAREAGLQF